MSIASELSALNGYILGAYDEINGKGGTVPANKNMANLASAISSIPGGGGGEPTIQGYNVISGTVTPDVTGGSLILMSYADFMSAVGGTMPSFSMLGIFNKSSSTPGFSHKFGYHKIGTSPHYVNSSGIMTRGSLSQAFIVWDPTAPGSSWDGVRVTTYSSGQFQAGTEYVWFILWKN